MFNLSNLSNCELVTLANIISVSISQGLSSDEIIALSGFFTIIGDSLAILSVNSEKNKNNC